MYSLSHLPVSKLCRRTMCCCGVMRRACKMVALQKTLFEEVLPDSERLAKHIAAILNIIGVDMEDENFADTPTRVSKAMLEEWFAGYNANQDEIIKVFPNDGKEKDLVIVKDI